MTINLAPLWKAVEPLWHQLKVLTGEHNLLTIFCAFLVVMMTISFYKMLRTISPALVGFVLLLLLGILMLHWTQTRSEPAILKPFIDWLAPFFPTSAYHVPVPPVKR